jgi:hypothetical protein
LIAPVTLQPLVDPKDMVELISDGPPLSYPSRH